MSMDRVDLPLTLCDASQLEQSTLARIFGDDGDRFWQQNSASNRVFLRRRPRYHDDPDNVGLFKDLSTRQVNYGPVGIMSLSHAILVGFRSFISRNGKLYSDQTFIDDVELQRFSDKLANADRFRNENTGLRRDEDGKFDIDWGQREIHRLCGTVVVLSSDEPENYGSFLFRVLSKLALVRLFDCGFPILAPSTPVYMDLFRLAGIDTDRIIKHETDAIYDIDHALIPTLRNPQAFLDEDTLGLFATIRERTSLHLKESVNHCTVRGRLLFVSRHGLTSTKAGYRRLLNSQEVIAAVTKLGFEIIEPQHLTIEQQIEAFASASVICGQSGAGLFNVVFCKPGTYIIDIESEPYWIHAHMCLFSSLNLRYGIIEGQCTEDGDGAHKPFTVNVGTVVRRLTGILEEISAQR